MAHHEEAHHHEHHHDAAHTEAPGAPGFGRNTGGTGILIIAVVAVVFFLSAWWLWNDGHEMVDHYRLTNTENSAHGEAGHQDDHADPAQHNTATMDTNAAHTAHPDTTHSAGGHTPDSSGGH